MWKSLTNKVFSKGNSRAKEPATDHKENESRSDQLGGANKSTEVKCVSSHMAGGEATEHNENESSSDQLGGASKTEKCVSSPMAEGEGSLIGQNNRSTSKAKMKTSTKRKGGDKVMIQNLTEKTLVFKEMIRGVHGPVRYVIGANDIIEIKLAGGLNTYYRLIVYAIAEVADSPSSSTTHATPTPPTPHGCLKSVKAPVDTGLTVDSDFLSDASCIYISGDQTQGYTISTEPPPSL